MPINALTAGVAALAINSTAFTIEIFRGGFAAVPVAQHDAARALGLRPALIMALVVVPQVFRIVLPPLGNQIVSVVLGSAQASIIGVAELTYQTQSIGSSTFRYFELFTIAALFYIACAQLISLMWRLLTGRAAHAPLGERRVEERERQHHHEPRHDEAHARHEGAHPSRARVAEEHRELRRRRTGQEIREREPFEEPLFAEPAALLLDLRLHHAEDAGTAIAHRAEREERRRNLVHGMAWTSAAMIPGALRRGN